MKAIELAKRYLLDPYVYLEPGNRQAVKIEKRLKIAARNLGKSKEATLTYLLSIAKRRVNEAIPTVYICNAGSSGSHWLQGLLSSVAPVLPCGEVYLPRKFLLEASNDTQTNKHAAVQLIYLVHAFVDANMNWDMDRLVRAMACNTAHAPAALASYRAMEKSSYAALLIRDPADIAISRTFRKDEYKSYLGEADSKDIDYLKLNCNFVNKFFEQVNFDNFDAIVRYEDVVADVVGPVSRVCETLGIDVPRKDIESAALVFKKENLIAGSGQAKASNVYSGEKKKVAPRFLDMAKKETAKIRTGLGYA